MIDQSALPIQEIPSLFSERSEPAMTPKSKAAAGETSDETLVRQCLAGDQATFAQLVDRYEARLLRFFRGMGCEAADAADLAQETFIKAYRNLPRFKLDRQFSTWLFTIAKRTAIDLFRSRRPSVEWGAEQDIEEQTPASNLETKSQVESFWNQAKRQLKPTQYLALWFRYGEELSIRETSEALRMSESRVKLILHRTRKKLASCLEIDYPSSR